MDKNPFPVLQGGASASAKDPVCGMTVNPEKAAARLEHGGKNYYFCGQGCATKFQSDPEKYLQTWAPAFRATHVGGRIDLTRRGKAGDERGCHGQGPGLRDDRRSREASREVRISGTDVLLLQSEM